MTLKPLLDRVVVKAVEAEETTRGGIILAAAAKEKPQIAEIVAVGPGGIVDGNTAGALHDMGISIPDVLADNDAYHALQNVDGLITTGPTGTNVNDLTVLLIRQ